MLSVMAHSTSASKTVAANSWIPSSLKGLSAFAGGGLNVRVTPGSTEIIATTSFTLLFSLIFGLSGAEHTVGREEECSSRMRPY